MVKNLPSNVGDVGSIPGRGTRIPHAAGQLSPCTATREPTRSGACMPQLEGSPYATTREKPAHHNEESARCNERSHVLQLRPNTAQNK